MAQRNAKRREGTAIATLHAPAKQQALKPTSNPGTHVSRARSQLFG
jgi:hypothetical protein